MPHLAGVFDQRESPSGIPQTLDRFVDVLSVTGLNYERREWHNGRFGAVNLLGSASKDQRQPGISEDGNRVAFIDGEIYNLEELASGIGLTATQIERLTPCQLCLALFEANGTKFAAQLNGQFNLAIYDAPEERVLLINDRFADRPLYYFHHGDVLYFALEQKAILSTFNSLPRLDDDALIAFLAFGHFLGDQTLFSGVIALPQGAILIADRNGLRVQKYWQPSYKQARFAGGFREVTEEWSRRMIAATARRTRQLAPLGLFLSGGLDSRFVAGAMTRAGAEVTAFTFGEEDSRDMRYARLLADRLGIRHRTLGRVQCVDPSVVRDVVWRNECSVPFPDCLSIVHHQTIRSEAGIVFNGHFGDTISGGHMLPVLFLLRNREQLLTHILAKRTLLNGDRFRRLFRPEALPAVNSRLRDAVQSTLVPLEEKRIPLLFNLWDMTVRQRRYTFTTPSVDRYLFEQLSPFLDNEVHELALSIPVRWLIGQRSYIRAILEGFPEIAEIPWARTGRPIERYFITRLGKLGWQHLQKQLSRRRQRPGQSLQAGRSLLQSESLRDMTTQFLRSDGFPHHLLDAEAISVLIDEHFAARVQHDREVSILLTLAAATELFLQRPVRDAKRFLAEGGR